MHFKNLNDSEGYLVSEIGYIDVILAPLFEVANMFSQGALELIMKNIATTRECYDQSLKEVKKKKGQSA